MRILAGVYKNRRLLSPPKSSRVRPITGLAKKSLFDMLGERVSEGTVVDLYCGTGTMGLEALSRGADKCYFADRDRAVLQRLRRNVQTLDVRRKCVIWEGDVITSLRTWLQELDGTVNVGFVDPPYSHTRRWEWKVVGDRIFVPLGRRLGDGGRVVLRLPTKVDLPETIGPLEVVRKRSYGNMVVVLLGKVEESE